MALADHAGSTIAAIQNTVPFEPFYGNGQAQFDPLILNRRCLLPTGVQPDPRHEGPSPGCPGRNEILLTMLSCQNPSCSSVSVTAGSGMGASKA
jgi:hypothetical protein